MKTIYELIILFAFSVIIFLSKSLYFESIFFAGIIVFLIFNIKKFNIFNFKIITKIFIFVILIYVYFFIAFFIDLNDFHSAIVQSSAVSSVYVLKIINITLLNLYFINSNSVHDLYISMLKLKIPDKFAISFIVLINIIPYFINNIRQIYTAQYIRGFSLKKINLSLFFVPVFINGLNYSQNLQLNFHTNNKYLKTVKMKPNYFEAAKYIIFLSSIIFTFFMFSCSKEIPDKVINYNVYVGKYNVGSCLKSYYDKNKIYEINCSLYFLNNSQKVDLNTTLTVKTLSNNKFEMIYKDNFKNIERIIDNDLIYPFLFEKFDEKTQIYHIELDKNVFPDEFKCVFGEKTINCPPYLYKIEEKKDFERIDLNLLKKIKTNNPKTEYPVNLTLKFKTSFEIESNERQKCVKENDFTICNIKYINKDAEIKQCDVETRQFDAETRHCLVSAGLNTENKQLLNFISKHNLKKDNDLILNIIKALHSEIKYKDISQNYSIDDILTKKEGDCNEFAKISVEILKAFNIKSNIVYGLYFKNGLFEYHAFVQFETNNETFWFDPTLKKINISPFYLIVAKENKYNQIIMPLDIDFIEINE